MIIAHLITDEKFIDFFYESVKDIKNVEHRFFILCSNQSTTLKYIKSTPIYDRIDGKIISMIKLRGLINECDSLIIHYMHSSAILAVLLMNKRKPILWSGWGADYYYLLDGGENGLLLKKTKALKKNLRVTKAKKKPPLLLIKTIITKIKINIIGKLLTPAMLKKINFFSSPIPNDFDKIKEKFPEFNPEYLQINYGSIEKTFLTGTSGNSGDDILVGNSASLTNNHIDTFEVLSKLDIGNRKIISPLSYGDEIYKKIILQEGRAYFGDKFQPLTDFMSLEDYNGIVSSCAIAIMNHKRQQALGNIGALLYSGKKLYLNEENPVYDFFKKRQAFVYKTSELRVDNTQIFTPLTENEIIRNRQVLSEFWGEDVVKRNAVALVERLRNF